jgi:hypothetical protein
MFRTDGFCGNQQMLVVIENTTLQPLEEEYCLQNPIGKSELKLTNRFQNGQDHANTELFSRGSNSMGSDPHNSERSSLRNSVRNL